MLRRASRSRFVALLLILWGMCDLTVPGLCKTDFVDIQAVPAQVLSPSNPATTHQQAPSVTQPKQDHAPTPAVPSSDTDDCWCCCSHIVTQPVGISLFTFWHVSEYAQTSRVESPMWRASEFFQPPKI
jgi:hypothetical protein